MFHANIDDDKRQVRNKRLNGLIIGIYVRLVHFWNFFGRASRLRRLMFIKVCQPCKHIRALPSLLITLRNKSFDPTVPGKGFNNTFLNSANAAPVRKH
jgi:hypothetical protein